MERRVVCYWLRGTMGLAFTKLWQRMIGKQATTLAYARSTSDSFQCSLVSHNKKSLFCELLGLEHYAFDVC
eukprot:3264184-Amphidinium_carterae.1